MQNTSDLYKSIRDNPLCSAETRATFAGVLYEQDRLSPPETSGSLFPDGKPSVGNCISRQLDLTIFPVGRTIPRMAEIKLETRLVIKDTLTGEVLQASEWIPKGTFYIDTRETDKVTGVMTIHGYDAMLKAEQMLLTETTEDDWPKPMDEVVTEIAARMGLTLDSRTVVSHAMTVGFPLEYTMRELLGYIAVAHAGNWIITDTGQLRLVKLTDTPAETYYLVSEEGDAILFGDTRILI